MRPSPILVVEDDDDLRHALCEALVQAGWSCEGAGGAREALDRMRRDPVPALVMVDLLMPDMDGWQFADERARDPTLAAIPIIVLSATESRRRPVGAAAELKKPVRLEALVDAVREVLASASGDSR